MDRDYDGEYSVTKFRRQLYEIVDDPSKDSIVSWSESGKSFIVRDEKEFRSAFLPSELLPYLAFSSQSHDQCEYACPYFMRGQPDLRPTIDDIKSNNETKRSNYETKGTVEYSTSNDVLLPLKSCKERAIARKGPRRTFSRYSLFIRDVYLMVDDPSTDSVVSWGESGNSFIVWNATQFLVDVLPSCLHFCLFKDMPSLTTWLEAIGYRKVEESEHWEYTADCLVRGQPPRE